MRWGVVNEHLLKRFYKIEKEEARVLKIIDVHTHLGDILNPGGGELIEKTGVRKRRIFDPVSLSEAMLHRKFGMSRFINPLLGRWITMAEIERNAIATRENFRKSMDEAGIRFSCCMPIPPYVTFEDLRRASQKDAGIIPFTGIDYVHRDFEQTLARDVANGAKGLKLHGIIQRMPLTSGDVFSAVEAFVPHGLPILIHCGVFSYYRGSRRENEEPEYGKVQYAEKLISSFPKARFIVGHSGLFEVNEVIERLYRYENVWVDTSFQPPSTIRKLIRAFGPEKVMYASDWPYGNRLPAVRAAKKACRGDRSLEDRIFWKNAAELLKMNV
ncbi:MAG: amidohydrolase family protein [Desulfomonilia bacterium]